MSTNQPYAAFAYQEPSITTVLSQAGLLLALNIVNVFFDKLLFCGLIGQLFIGILWGTPGCQWISSEIEKAIQQLGYLGLIILVYSGGLSMSTKALRANVFLSVAVALTGIITPIALSFILKELVGASSLQAFAAGAALGATSLGTTFTILSTTQLVTTRLGAVITCAAMLDDVVGLVMVQVISNLGGNSSGGSRTSIGSVTIIRPVFVSIGFAVGVFLLCRLCLKPVIQIALGSQRKMPRFMRSRQFAFLAHTVGLFGMVAGATYAGTSSLFAAYLSGVIVSWVDELIASSRKEDITVSDSSQSVSIQQSSSSQGSDMHTQWQQRSGHTSSNAPPATQESTPDYGSLTGHMIYESYYKQPVDRILVPLFFASIGFAIPITDMFQGNIVWRGLVYAFLMAFGKMVTGIWLIRFSSNPVYGFKTIFKKALSCARIISCAFQRGSNKESKNRQPRKKNQPATKLDESSMQSNDETRSGQGTQNSGRPVDDVNGQQELEASLTASNAGTAASQPPLPPKPKSLYPPSILGLAMIARGEVGYLIASLAQSQGIFTGNSDGSSGGSSDIYLVIIWAITICTLIGPIAVGTLVRRVKRLHKMRECKHTEDPLGVWGI